MNLKISKAVMHKLASKHGVAKHEIVECFANRERGFLEDNREEHTTDPKTQWFVAETNHGRLLKVMFMFFADNGEVRIKSAYEATDEIAGIYEKHA